VTGVGKLRPAAASLALAASALAGALLLAGAPGGATAPPPRPMAEARIKPQVWPLRRALFGDIHLHTTFSFDAYVLTGTRMTPEEAYRFARGETVQYMGVPVRRSRPLDFEAVTDHSENLGVLNQLDDKQSPFWNSPMGSLLRGGLVRNLAEIVRLGYSRDPLGPAASKQSDVIWRREIAAANANYEPGRFTTLIGYEWSSMPGGQNIHRNVLFRGSDAPMPFTSIDSDRPEDLWAWMERNRRAGFDSLAIPHNANASNGLMYSWNMSDGRPIDRAWAQARLANEPLMEVVQNKGASETHPALSPNDEFANFEIFDYFLVGDRHSSEPGSYWRDALGRGMAIAAREGINPFKQGVVGSGDLHGGLSVSSEEEYGGSAGASVGKARMSKALVKMTFAPPDGRQWPQIIASSPGLTGVWAESNTREAIFDALRRRETFATSGTRLQLRVFGGWDLDPGLLRRRDWVKAGYASGVPMGSDLKPRRAAAGAPTFAILAAKDPDGANLDRVQVIKVWFDGRRAQERVFDVAWAGRRRIDPISGKLPAIGNTVDLGTGKYANTLGATQLSAFWRDPAFDAAQQAAYYVRVLEIPTPRWSTLRAIEFGLPLSKLVPPTIQERAWSSPIWYVPAKAGR
jgi:hypothetical protein